MFISRICAGGVIVGMDCKVLGNQVHGKGRDIIVLDHSN